MAEMKLGMIYTCNMESFGKCKRWEKVNILCIVYQNHGRSVVVLDPFRSFKGI